MLPIKFTTLTLSLPTGAGFVSGNKLNQAPKHIYEMRQCHLDMQSRSLSCHISTMRQHDSSD